jgi:WD40 repeat protein
VGGAAAPRGAIFRLAAVLAVAAGSSRIAAQDEGARPWAFRTEDRIARIAPSPDGTKLYLGDRAGVVWIHDAADGRQIGRIEAHKGEVAALAFVGADPALLVSSARAEFVRLWDGGKGTLRRKFDFPGSPAPEVPDADGTLVTRWDHVFCVAVARDTPLFAMADPTHRLVVWDAAKDAEVASFTFENWASGASIAPDLSRIALAIGSGDEQRVEVRPLGGGPAIWSDPVCEADSDAAARSHLWEEVEYSPDGKTLLSWGWGSTGEGHLGGMRAYDAATGKRRWTRLYDYDVWDATYSPAGDRIALTSPRGVSLFDAATGEEVIGFESSSGVMVDVAFSPDGHWLYAAPHGAEGIVRWDVSAEVKVVTPLSPRAAPKIAAAPAAPDAARGKQPAGAPKGASISHGAAATAIAVSPDGVRVATGGSDGAVRVWNASSGTKVAEFTGVGDGVTWVGWVGGDRDRLAACGADGIVRCYAVASGRKTCEFDAKPPKPSAEDREGRYLGVAASPSGAELFVAGMAGGVTTYDADSGRSRSSASPLGTLEDVPTFLPQAIAVSPNGRRFVTMGTDILRHSEGRVFDRDRSGTSWTETAALADREDDSPIEYWHALAILRDGTAVVGASETLGKDAAGKAARVGLVRAWDLAQGTLRWRLALPEAPDAGALSPRGDYFAVSQQDGARLVAMANGSVARTLPAAGQTVRSLAFSPDGARLFAGTKSGAVLTWSVAGGK